MPIVGGAYYTLEEKSNYIYIALDIRIILYCGANNETSLVLLSILGEGALDSLCPLGSRRICNNDRGHVVRCYICAWLLVSVLGQAVEVGNRKVI
jgi:hypothetical protein